MVTHKYELGTVVATEVRIQASGDGGVEIALAGHCCLIVVGHLLSPASEPLYILSDIPVRYPMGVDPWSIEAMRYRSSAGLLEFGYAETDLAPTGGPIALHEDISLYLDLPSQ